MLTAGFIALARGGRWAYRIHKPTGVIMGGLTDYLFSGAMLLDFARIQHHDMIRDLRHHREIMGHIDRRRTFLLDH